MPTSKKLVRTAALIGLGLLAACGGRMANPAPEATIYDRYMTCDDIRKEVAGNYEAQSDLARELVWAKEKNDMIRGLSLAFPPGWFALDMTAEEDYPGTPQDIETLALGARNRHIIGIAKEQGCWPDPAVWSPVS